MGKTHAQRMKSREDRLQTMPRKARYAKSADIKRKEGRVLDANEKRAVKMRGSHGDIMRAWEILRASADKVEEKIEAMRQQAKLHGADASGNLALAKEDFESATGKREAAVQKVLELIKPKFDEVARTPTVSRVIQSCIKFGTAEQRTKILLMFTPKFTEYCTDGFAHFAIEAMIRHANKADFKAVLNLALNVLNNLVTHKCGIRIVNALYNDKLCSTAEKHMLVLGIFKDNVAVMKSWPGFPVLEDIMEGQKGAQRKRLLTVLFETTDKLVSQKEAFEFPFVQRLLYAVFTAGAQEQVEELAATVKGNLVSMALASREGARLASVAFAVLPPKSRKIVLQDLVQRFDEVAMAKHSPPFIARCFDLTYDPQMATKFLVAPLTTHIGPISGSPYGCRILLHLLTPDAARKAKVMLPGFEEHNLYSRSNESWNHHTWRDDNTLEAVTVEVCPKPAEGSHRAVLGPIVQAFVETVCKVKGLQENKTLKGFVACIAAEISHLLDAEPAYAKAMGLSADQVELVRSLMSNKERKRTAGDDEAPAAAAPSPAKKAASPKAAGSAATPVRKSEAAAVASTPKGSTTKKKAAKAEVEASPAPVAAPVAVEPTPTRKSARRSVTVAPTPAPASARKSHRAEEAGPSSAVEASATKKQRASARASAVVAEGGDDDAPMEVSARAPVEEEEATPARASKAARRSAKATAAAATPKSAARPSAGKKGSVTPGSAKKSSAVDKL